MRRARKQSSPALSPGTGEFRRALSGWFEKHSRDLPWRRTRDPYAVLVSEVMLQQTQVSAVLPYYNEWLSRFPTLASLARAREPQVLRAWEGLGYYARARNLHRAAKLIVQKFGAELPDDPEKLQSLPGVGPYTANAVTVFAYDHSRPIVEANTARVLARLFDLRHPIDSAAGRKILWEMAAQITPARAPRKFGPDGPWGSRLHCAQSKLPNLPGQKILSRAQTRIAADQRQTCPNNRAPRITCPYHQRRSSPTPEMSYPLAWHVDASTTMERATD